MSKIFFLSLVIALIVAALVLALVQFCQSTLANQTGANESTYFYQPQATYSADLLPALIQNKIVRILCGDRASSP